MSFGKLATEIEGALLELEGDLANDTDLSVFTWKGVDIPCVPNMRGTSSDLVFGGHDDVTSFSLVVRVSHFLTADTTLVTADDTLNTADNHTPRPIAGMRLIYKGHTYKIDSAVLDPARAYVKLVLVDKDSGR